MKLKFFLLLLGIYSFFLPTLFFRESRSPELMTSGKTLGTVVSAQKLPTHPLRFFDSSRFYFSLRSSTKGDADSAKKIFGGIVPHHLLASSVIADFFGRLSLQPVKTIIIIGPNHYERGDYPVLSSLSGWETPFGVVEPDGPLIEELLKNRLAKIDEEALSDDQSAAALIPFVKYFLPKARVVPLLLSNFLTEREVRRLSNALKDYEGLGAVIVASIDFSHYLTSRQAAQNDEVTLQVIKIRDYRRLLSLNSDFLDSPPSAAVLLQSLESLGASQMNLLFHGNSGEMVGRDSTATTSYFSILFHQ